MTQRRDSYQRKLNPPRGEVHCANCIHMKRATKAHKLLILEGDRVIAEGPASRIPYCELAEATAKEILELTDFQTQAEKCQREGHFRFRPGREPPEED